LILHLISIIIFKNILTFEMGNQPSSNNAS